MELKFWPAKDGDILWNYYLSRCFAMTTRWI